MGSLAKNHFWHVATQKKKEKKERIGEQLNYLNPFRGFKFLFYSYYIWCEESPYPSYVSKSSVAFARMGPWLFAIYFSWL